MSTIATPNQKIFVGVPANSSERVLVNHPTQSATAIDGWKSVFFGLPFLAAGIFIAAAALDYIGGSKHAPNWLIGLIGFFFFAAGAFLIIHGLRGVAQKSKYDSEARTAPHEPWLYDYHWQREGIAFSAFSTMLQRLVAALVWNTFLIPFFWIGLTQRGAWVFAIFAGLFALIGLVFWFRWAQMLAEFLRYGNSFLEYNAFPYFPGSTLSARLRAPNHLADIDELTLTLRCVQERYVTSGSGDNRSTKVVCFELYSASQSFSRAQLTAYSNQTIPIEFALPDSQPTTSLTSTPPTYWEIEASGKSSKVNLQAFFLVPVYKPGTS